MNQKEFLLASIRNQAYRHRAWVFSTLSITSHDFDWDFPDRSQGLAPFQILRGPQNDRVFFWNPDSQVMEELTGIDPNFPAFRPDDEITLDSSDWSIIKEPTVTKFGRILTNLYYFYDVLGDRAPFFNQEFSKGMLESFFKKYFRNKDHPKYNDPDTITYDQFKACINNGFSMAPFSRVCVATACPETMYPPRWLVEMRDKLFEEHKDQLSDPLVMGRIQEQLLKAYKEFLATTPSKNSFIKAKTINDAFNKMFVSGGISTNFGVSTVVTRSLYEGWDLKQLPALANSSIEASFGRGASTADGGEKVKMLIRATQNIMITQDDCGATLGIPWTVDQHVIKSQVDAYGIINGKTVLLTPEILQANLGKAMLIRSPDFCKKSHGDTCRYCAGAHNATNDRGTSSGASAIGSKIMLLSMKAMHKGSKIDLVELDLDEIFF
ncbi:hypothetical protein pEaSNUABM37_00310 [Erwinia phage pEa_SNUABM_37]|nr:hypothetical protein pEaSNUABM37_00310 [Erwinia phage pEa_SNUABM_37]QXO10778.1 hypothetical protein pEaSNUABM48_00310 [Erwinia phage pEa_SNUABM_48]